MFLTSRTWRRTGDTLFSPLLWGRKISEINFFSPAASPKALKAQFSPTHNCTKKQFLLPLTSNTGEALDGVLITYKCDLWAGNNTRHPPTTTYEQVAKHEGTRSWADWDWHTADNKLIQPVGFSCHWWFSWRHYFQPFNRLIYRN